MSLTGLPKKLEEAFLRQITEEELRARRALRILEHQQIQIKKLQKHQHSAMSRQDHHSTSLSDDEEEDDDAEGHKPQYEKNLVYLMKQTLLEKALIISSGHQEEDVMSEPVGFNQIVGNQSTNNLISSNNPQKNVTSDPGTKVEKETMSTRKNVLESSKRKIQNLESLVKELEESNNNNEVNFLLEEMSGWRSAIDNALLPMEESAKSVVFVVDNKVWKTALRFFTPSEAMHFLSTSQKIGKNTVPKVSSCL